MLVFKFNLDFIYLKKKIGTTVYEKLRLLCNKTLVNDMINLSPDDQTSCLKGFHEHWTTGTLKCCAILGLALIAGIYYICCSSGSILFWSVFLTLTGYVKEINKFMFSLSKETLEQKLKTTKHLFQNPSTGNFLIGYQKQQLLKSRKFENKIKQSWFHQVSSIHKAKNQFVGDQDLDSNSRKFQI